MSKSHLKEVDYLRVFGLVSIVFIHSWAYYFSMPGLEFINNTFQGLMVNLLRYGRFIFIFVTGLVMFYSYKDRELNVKKFYKRRLHNLVIPYAVWTAIFLFISRDTNVINWSGLDGFAAAWFINLFTGDAFYHLYYIIVTLQFYLFLPLLLLVFKPRRKRLCAGVILVSGLVLCAIYYYWLELQAVRILNLAAGTPWAGFTDLFTRYKDRLLIFYLPFYMLGALAGLYLEECKRWLVKHSILIGVVLLFGASAVVAEYFYLFKYLGQNYILTISVFKPSMYVYSLSIIGMIFWLSTIIARKGYLDNLISVLSANSLGIYLIHPAVLYMQHTFYYKSVYNTFVPGSLLVLIDPILAVFLSCLFAMMLGSIPYIGFIMGKAGHRTAKHFSWRNWVKNAKWGHSS